MNDLTIEYPSFQPSRRVGSFVGFLSFKIGREYSWYKLGVHILRKPNGNVKIRLVYPDRQGPPTKVMQEELDQEANAYILANYPEVLR